MSRSFISSFIDLAACLEDIVELMRWNACQKRWFCSLVLCFLGFFMLTCVTLETLNRWSWCLMTMTMKYTKMRGKFFFYHTKRDEFVVNGTIKNVKRKLFFFASSSSSLWDILKSFIKVPLKIIQIVTKVSSFLYNILILILYTRNTLCLLFSLLFFLWEFFRKKNPKKYLRIVSHYEKGTLRYDKTKKNCGGDCVLIFLCVFLKSNDVEYFFVKFERKGTQKQQQQPTDFFFQVNFPTWKMSLLCSF